MLENLPWKDMGDYLEKSVEKTFDTIFSTLDGIEGEVKVLLDKDLQLSRDKLAEEIISQSSKATAMIGGSAALPDLLPTAWPALIPSIAGDFALTLRAELAMLLKLAYLYGPDLPREERKKEAVGILAAYRAPEGERGSAAREVGIDVMKIGSKHVTRKAFVVLAKKLAERYFKKKLVAVVPVVGIALSGGVNYLGTRSLGDFAKRYYQNRRVPETEVSSVSGEVAHFQRCYLQVMINMAKIDRQVPKEEEDLLKDSLLMFGYPKEEQERFLADLHNLEVNNPITHEDIGRLTEEDCRFILKQGIAMIYADKKKSIQEANYLEVLRKRFSLTPEVVVALEAEVKTEMGIA
ncbi:MAG: DUF533 domain-containing protein [Candidatus Riflebacteria bacterium]|nr:DUF533 domain-containing protein [Candidatus Riflebacteria bacterium]